jgi:hypothetical protein
VKAEQFGGIVIDVPSRWEQQRKGEYLYLFPPDFGGREMFIVISVKNSLPMDLRSWLEEQVRATLQNARIIEEEMTGPLDLDRKSPGLKKRVVIEHPDPVKRNITFIALQGQGHAECLAIMSSNPRSLEHYREDIAVISQSIRSGTVDSQRAARNARFIEQVQQQRIQEAADEERAEAERQNRMIQNAQKENAAASKRLHGQIESIHEGQMEDLQKGRTNSFPSRPSVSPYR